MAKHSSNSFRYYFFADTCKTYNPSSDQKWSINCCDHKLTQLLQWRCLHVLISIDREKRNFSYRVVVFFLGNAHALRFEMRRKGYLNLLCTFPGGHWIRENIKCGHHKVVCLFKQETSEGARWPLWKRGRNPTTKHRNIAKRGRNPTTKHRNIAKRGRNPTTKHRNIASQPASQVKGEG